MKILLVVFSLVLSTCILYVALRELLKSLNNDGKFEQAEEEYLRGLKFEDLVAGNPE